MPAVGGSKSGAPKPGMKRKRVAEPVVSQEDDKRVVAAGLAAGAGVHTVHLPTADGYTDVYVSRVRDAPLHLVLYTHRPPLSSVEWASVLDRALEGGWHVVSSGNASALVHDAVEAAHGPASTAGDGALPPLYYTRIRVEDEADAARVLRLPSEFPDTDASGLLLGLKGWLSAHQTHAVEPRALQSAVDAYMAAFDEAEAAAAAAREELAARMSADGFTLVRKTKTAMTGEDERLASDNVKRKLKRGSVVAPDFYGFQKRESKIDRLAELRAKFEEDKQRIRKLKDTRKFRPY